MTDIVERLRAHKVPQMHEAADTITTLRAEVETVGAMHRDACELAKHRMQEIERLRADLAHADAKGQENDKLLWGTIKANERLTNAEECLRDDLTVARDENERLRAAMDTVRASGLLIGSTTLHDRVRSAVYNAIDALAEEKKG